MEESCLKNKEVCERSKKYIEGSLDVNATTNAAITARPGMRGNILEKPDQNAARDEVEKNFESTSENFSYIKDC